MNIGPGPRDQQPSTVRQCRTGKTFTLRNCLFALLLAAPGLSAASDSPIDVPMIDHGASTFYVNVQAIGTALEPFLVDTGSSYTAINEGLLAQLVEARQAEYLKDLRGTLADGSTQVVPLYRIKSLMVGERCLLSDVRAAVFPGKTRNILGLSALRMAAPFGFSFDPPRLTLSHCQTAGAAGLGGGR